MSYNVKPQGTVEIVFCNGSSLVIDAVCFVEHSKAHASHGILAIKQDDVWVFRPLAGERIDAHRAKEAARRERKAAIEAKQRAECKRHNLYSDIPITIFPGTAPADGRDRGSK